MSEVTYALRPGAGVMWVKNPVMILIIECCIVLSVFRACLKQCIFMLAGIRDDTEMKDALID